MISLCLLSLYLIALASVAPMAHLGYPLAVALTLPITLLAMVRGLRGHGALDLLIPIAAFTLILEPINGCDFGQGLVWLLLGPGVGFCLGFSFGSMGRTWLGGRWGALLTGGTVVLSLSAAGWRLYSQPQLFSYEAFFGSWHGPIYDEWVVVKGSLVAFRMGLLLLAGAMLWARKTPSNWSVAAVLILVIATLPGWYLGDRQALAEVLSERIEERGIVVHHHPGKKHRKAAQAVLHQSLFERDDLVQGLLGDQPPPPVTIWLYPDRGTKGRLIGAHGVIIARPWQSEIHMHGSKRPDPHLRHEMVHVLGAALAGGPFGVPLSPLPDTGLIEGLAVALGPHDSEISLQGAAAGMLEAGNLPSIDALFSVRFSLGHGRRSYRAAGAFLQFIAQEKGWQPLIDAYRRGGLKTADLDLKDLEQRWHTSLRERPKELGARRALIRGYSGHSVLDRACPNEVQTAWRAAQTKDPISPEERERRYRVVMALSGNCRPLASLADRYFRLGDHEAQRRVEDEMLARGASQRDLGRLFMRRADQAAKHNAAEAIEQHLARALATAPPPHRYRGLLVRWLLRHDPANLGLVVDYLTETDRKLQRPLGEAMVQAYHDAPTTSRPALAYLLARWYSIHGALDAAERWSRRAHPLPPTLAQERLRFGARLAERQKAPCRALARWRALAEISPPDLDLLPQRVGLLTHSQPDVARCGIAPTRRLR